MGIGRRIESGTTPPPSRADVSTVEANTACSLVVSKYTLSDLIVSESTAASLADFLAYRRNEDLIFNKWGLAKTHVHQRQTCINLYGPPGTGKTMAAQAIAHGLGLPLLMVDYADLESKYVGETSKNISKLFKLAQEKNAILFFDEADAIISRRVTNMSHSTDVSVNQTRSVMLTLMNDHEGLVIFATNFIENYDPAFMRRILAHIHFDLPDAVCRKKLWFKYIPDVLPCDVDISQLVDLSGGLSGSDISNCVLKAALSAARQGAKVLALSHFESAINEVFRSKSANSQKHYPPATIEQRIVSEDYVKARLGVQSIEDVKV